KNIISICPKQRQTLLFSATYPEEIKQLSKQFMKGPAEVTDQLIYEGFSATALNGDMEQVDRDLAVLRFANQSCSILVATDVAARGLDIKELSAVINFDLAFDHDVHIHRIGRTGRAGNKGIALSLITPADAQRVCSIEDNHPHPIHWGNINELENHHTTRLVPEMVTLCLASGKKDKIRPGDILGALTKDAGLEGNTIGKINITAMYSYVAIHHSQADKAYQYLQSGKLKGRKVSVRKIN
ncbi:ATP-dependent RNA helicase DbpA, partial [Legionella santicrucis]